MPQSSPTQESARVSVGHVPPPQTAVLGGLYACRRLKGFSSEHRTLNSDLLSYSCERAHTPTPPFIDPRVKL